MKRYTCGIYKITNPKGRIYIGQSVAIEKRWMAYRGLHSKGQLKLHNSFLKYGVSAHKFEILQVCEKDELNKLEAYYIDFYSALCGINGLNCSYVDDKRRTIITSEMRAKMAKSQIGRIQSEETKRKISEKAKGRVNNITPEGRQKIIDTHKGRKISEETREKMRAAQQGKIITNEVREKLRKTHKKLYANNPDNHPIKKCIEKCIGKKLTEEHKKKCSDALRGRKHSEETKKKIALSNLGKKLSADSKKKMSDSNWLSVLVLNLETGIYYNNITSAAKSIGKQKNYLVNRLSGETINKTSFIRV